MSSERRKVLCEGNDGSARRIRRTSEGLIGVNACLSNDFTSGRCERLHMIFMRLRGVFGILAFAMQRIFSVGGGKQPTLAVHDGNANAQCSKINTGDNCHLPSSLECLAPVRLTAAGILTPCA